MYIASTTEIFSCLFSCLYSLGVDNKDLNGCILETKNTQKNGNQKPGFIEYLHTQQFNLRGCIEVRSKPFCRLKLYIFFSLTLDTF